MIKITGLTEAKTGVGVEVVIPPPGEYLPRRIGKQSVGGKHRTSPLFHK